MKSRLLIALESKSHDTRNRVGWSIVNCRIAIHHARQGNPQLANEYIQLVRRHYGNELHHAVASWVMLAEGILHFTQGDIRRSYDRILRAHGLAVPLKTTSVRSVSAAWMALIEFNSGKFELMCGHLEEALVNAELSDHQALGRASLTMADALQFAGTFEDAKPWYESARQHAVAEGDQATLSAYLYNVAVFRTVNIRLADAFDEVSAAELKRASMEANSSFTYDMAVRSVAFISFWKMLHGQLLTIRGEYSEAKILYDAIDMSLLASHEKPLVYADLAWCNLQLGNRFDSEDFYRRGLEASTELTEPDDSAFTLSRLSRVAEKLGLLTDSEQLMTKARAFFERHRKVQENLHTMLKDVSSRHSAHEKRPGISGPAI